MEGLNKNPSDTDSEHDSSNESSASSTDLDLFVRSTRKIVLSIATEMNVTKDEGIESSSSPTEEPKPPESTHERSPIPSPIPDVKETLVEEPQQKVINPCLEKQKERKISTPELPLPNASMNTSRSLDKLSTIPPSATRTAPSEVFPVFDDSERFSTSSQGDSFSGISPKGTQQSSRKGKMGIPFFKSKPTLSGPLKQQQQQQLPMKELQRMIRAGKPSFEQIHSWRHSFETLLNDRFGLALFKDFLHTEFSDENIEFWIACQDYKKITNPKKLALRAQRIFDEFIAVQANREVNLDSKTRLQTEADLSNPTPHTLDNAQKRIQALMEKDSYRRFLRSDVYLTLYSEAKEVAKAVAASALAASLQEATSELDGAVLNLVTSSTSQSHFGFFSSHMPGPFGGSSPGAGLHLPGVAAAAACAEAGMNCVQDLQLLGLSTSRHMRNLPSQSKTTTTRSSIRKSTPQAAEQKVKSEGDTCSEQQSTKP